LRTLPLEVCVCVCVRQREKVVWNVLHGVHLNVSKTMIITANLLVDCVTSERERKVQRKIAACVVATLPLYPLKMTAPEDFY